MIKALGLYKKFDNTTALDGLGINVPAGAVYGLVGPNGAGKSTFIRCLCGAYRADSGELTVDGMPVYENPAVKERMICIPDQVFYFGSASTRDMRSFYADIYPGFDPIRYTKLQDAFGIDENTPIRRLSKGMQKQSAFWLAMSLRPDILVLDEPVDGLDPVMRRQVWSMVMADVAENGTTVLVSSHNLRELEDVCDHVGIMDKGRMLMERSLAQLQENIFKVQLAIDGDEGGTTVFPGSLPLLHHSTSGRLHTLIIRGNSEDIEGRIAALEPLFFDMLPLSLEEIFIYELGGADYAVKNIIL